MSEELIRVGSPEEEELSAKKSELSFLSELLAEKELEFEELKLSVARFQHRYFVEVGCKYVELDDLLAQLTEARAQRRPDDVEAKAAATEARERASATAAEYEGFESSPDISKGKPTIPDHAKKLYRKIASLIHPDKATDERSRNIRSKLMAELNEAYAAGNVNRMREILAEWESSPDTVTGEGTAADLVRVIRAIAQVRQRFSEIEKEIARIRASDIHSLMLEVHKADSAGKDILQEMAASVDCQIDRARAELMEVT